MDEGLCAAGSEHGVSAPRPRSGCAPSVPESWCVPEEGLRVLGATSGRGLEEPVFPAPAEGVERAVGS